MILDKLEEGAFRGALKVFVPSKISISKVKLFLDKLTAAYLMVPNHPMPARNKYMLPCHRSPPWVYISSLHLPSSPVLAIIITYNHNKSHLFSLAFPALFALVWPFIDKCSFPRLDHPCAKGVFAAQLLVLLSDRCNNRPSAIWRMLEMFKEWFIMFFPSVEGVMA